MIVDEYLVPAEDIQKLMNVEPGRPEEELGEELEHFDFEFDEVFAAEEADEWERPDEMKLEDSSLLAQKH